MSSVAILCYHKVGASEREGRRLNIEPSNLKRHVEFFVRRGWRFLQGSDLFEDWRDNSVAFTFDDAYESTMTVAPSIFDRFGVRATFFAVPSLVGRSSEWDQPFDSPLAGWDLLRSAADAGHEIGNHTMTHPHMAELSHEQQVREISDARRELESRGFCSDTVCYPYGEVGEPKALSAAGYRIGLALGRRRARLDDDRLQLPRIVVAYSDRLPMLLYKIHVKPRLQL